MVKIDIISGFLGAGKTTFIKMLLNVLLPSEEKVVLVENEFGKVGIDGELLKQNGVEVYELTNGCICCTMKDDFFNTLTDIVDKVKPDRIIFEPSGIFVLSDVLDIFKIPSVASSCRINSLITIVDSVFFLKQNSKFGYFFNNQIANSSKLVLSKTQLVSGKEIGTIIEKLREINDHAEILAKDWIDLDDDYLWYILGENGADPGMSSVCSCDGCNDNFHGDGCNDHLHDNDHEGQHNSLDNDHEGQHNSLDDDHKGQHNSLDDDHKGQHNSLDDDYEDQHDSMDDDHEDQRDSMDDDHEEVHGSLKGHGLDTFGIATEKAFTSDELASVLKNLASNEFGRIVRGKGLFRSQTGFIGFDYIDGWFEIKPVTGNYQGKVSFIGEKLNGRKLGDVFAQ